MPSPAHKQASLARLKSPQQVSVPKVKAITIGDKYRWVANALVASNDLLLLAAVTLSIELLIQNTHLRETGLLLLVNILVASVLSTKTKYFDFKNARHSLGKACVIALTVWFSTLFILALSHSLNFKASLMAMLALGIAALASGTIHHRFQWHGQISNPNDPYYQIEFAIKRFIDISVASIGLLAVSPLLLATTILLCLESKGSPFFRQTRVGYQEKYFPMFKFRSMRLDSHYQPQRQQGILFKNEDDPRITRIGKLIRKLSIDEIPQLLNVIRGEMSLIGPRPVLENEFKAMNWYHKRKFEVLPGMTGLWQITGRIHNKRDFLSVANYDVHYIESWCLIEDFKILFKTIPVVLFQRGAC